MRDARHTLWKLKWKKKKRKREKQQQALTQTNLQLQKKCDLTKKIHFTLKVNWVLLFSFFKHLKALCFMELHECLYWQSTNTQRKCQCGSLGGDREYKTLLIK